MAAQDTATAPGGARPYQIIVWGATGYTGRLVCERLATEYQGKCRWAMAGRNEGKLRAVRNDLEKIDARCKDVPLILADAEDQASIDEMVAQTEVIIATAGPFALCGECIVDASVRMGTHYCDVTGETPWVRGIIRKYHDAAKDRGVNIVPFCGQDSVPSDIGAWFVVNHMKTKLGRKCARVEGVITKLKAGLSGGTLKTISLMVSKDSAVIADPYCLDPPESRRGSDGPDQICPAYQKELGVWTGPFLGGGFNTRVVRRSNALLGHVYGDDFKYTESWSQGSWLKACMLTLLVMFVMSYFKSRFLQWLFGRWAPKPGEGPSREERSKGLWEFCMVGVTQEEAGAKPTIVKATVGVRSRSCKQEVNAKLDPCALERCASGWIPCVTFGFAWRGKAVAPGGQ
eukprot:evm.model.scf_2725.1 EVM.evm.TU.scf_2725.1   scf_2725:11911-17424(-)